MRAKSTPEKAVFTVTDSLDDADAREIGARLGAEVAAQFGPRDEKPLTILAHDETGALLGGLVGVSHWRWVYVRNFWIAADARGQGLGQRLIEACEREARTRGCIGLYLDTFNADAARFYARCGFTIFGAIPNFPPGASRTFLRKALD